MKEKGVVFNIQRFTVHDGPGIRTEIFLKGCTLRCRWCSNPESFLPNRQVGVYAVKCLGTESCGDCIAVCPKVSEQPFVIEDGIISGIDRTICDDCMKCSEACPADALKSWGNEMTVDEVMRIICADRNFYKKSGGGVTISGGESLFQWEFALEILNACKEQGIHTCVETALGVKASVVEQIVPYCDMMITDIKHMDSEEHKRYTGMGNELILSNIKRVSAAGIPLVLRLPIIPGVNDTREHVERVREFLAEELENPVVQVQFLRFRRLGEEKYKSLGLPYNMEEVNPERTGFETRIKELADILNQAGIPAYPGTTHKIECVSEEE